MSSSEIAMECQGLSKIYRTTRYSQIGSLGDLFRRYPRGAKNERTVWALKDVSFRLARGQILGVIGPNGAGKSTLLRLISRITEPDQGEITIRGPVGSLLDIGAGFHPELTGRENVYLYGAILGMTRPEIRRKFDEIVSFADLTPALNTPVKYYSSGMYLRLAFAVAAHVEPEVLLLDEIVSVGDFEFQTKCVERIRSMAASDSRATMIVSHNLQLIRELCDEVILLEGGIITYRGSPRAAIDKYLSHVDPSSSTGYWDLAQFRGSERSNPPILQYLRAFSDETPSSPVLISEGSATFAVGVQGLNRFPDAVIGLRLSTDVYQSLITVVTHEAPRVMPSPREHSEVVEIHFPSIPLAPGRYFVDVSVGANNRVIDGAIRAAVVEIRSEGLSAADYVAQNGDGVIPTPYHWRIGKA